MIRPTKGGLFADNASDSSRVTDKVCDNELLGRILRKSPRLSQFLSENKSRFSEELTNDNHTIPAEKKAVFQDSLTELLATEGSIPTHRALKNLLEPEREAMIKENPLHCLSAVNTRKDSTTSPESEHEMLNDLPLVSAVMDAYKVVVDRLREVLEDLRNAKLLEKNMIIQIKALKKALAAAEDQLLKLYKPCTTIRVSKVDNKTFTKEK